MDNNPPRHPSRQHQAPSEFICPIGCSLPRSPPSSSSSSSGILVVDVSFIGVEVINESRVYARSLWDFDISSMYRELFEAYVGETLLTNTNFPHLPKRRPQTLYTLPNSLNVHSKLDHRLCHLVQIEIIRWVIYVCVKRWPGWRIC